MDYLSVLFARYLDGGGSGGGVGVATLQSIKGNTLVWNQLVSNGNFASTSGWSGTRVTLSASNNELTATVFEGSTGKGQRVYKNLGINDNHTRLYTCEMKTTSGVKICMGSNTADAAGYTILASATANGGWQKLSAISSLNHAFILMGLEATTSVNDAYQIRNVQVFDLTQMFGSGNEPTLEEFSALFYLPYYDYDSGSLLNLNGTGIKTTGKNLINESDAEIGTAWNGGSNSARARLVISCYPNTTYVLSINGSNNIDNIYAQKSDVLPASSAGGSITSPYTIATGASDVYIIIGFNKTSISLDDVKALKLQLEFGSTATTYEPYTTNTTSLPISTYFPTGMKSAGAVYDELTPTRAITRVGAVDLGSLTWTTANTSAKLYQASISDMKVPTVRNADGILCGKYPISSTTSLGTQTDDESMLRDTSTAKLYIRDTTYDSPSALKTALSGVMLNYELATPTETATSLNLTYDIDWGGTEQLLPVNTSDPTTSPILADMEYPDEARSDQEFTYREIQRVSDILNDALNIVLNGE